MNETRPARRPPSVDVVLRTAAGTVAAARFGHEATVKAIRQCVTAMRDAARAGGASPPAAEEIAAQALQVLELADAPNLRRVFNLTGTVLHTNIGRAGLAESESASGEDAVGF